MRRLLKYLGLLVLVLVVVALAAVFLIPRERIVALAAERVKAATGRELVIAGEVSPSFWPVLGVRVGDVRLANAPWGEAPAMVSAKALEIGAELLPLLSGEVKIARLRLVEPTVALEIDARGRANWVFEGAGGPVGPAVSGGAVSGGAASGGTGSGMAGTLARISLPVATMTGGRVSYRDARTGRRIELADLDLEASLPGPDAPLALSGAALWNGARTLFSLRMDAPLAALEERESPVAVALEAPPVKLGFEGRFALPADAPVPALAGSVTVISKDPAATLRWATGEAPPAALAEAGPLAIEGDIELSAAALSTSLTGQVAWRDRPVQLSLRTDGEEGWLERRRFGTALELRSPGLIDLAFAGAVTAADAPRAEGRLTAKVADLPGAAEWAAGARLDTPPGTLPDARLAAKISADAARVSLAGLILELGETRLAGAASVALDRARPFLSADLESGPLDLTPFTRGRAAPAPGGGTSIAEGWSTEPLDLAPLRAIDADIALRAEAIDLGEIELGRSELAALLEDGRLDLTIRRIDAWGGGMNGWLTLTAGDAAEVATEFTVSKVQLRPLLRALSGFDALEGIGDFTIRARGRGRSMDALMRSLAGDGRLGLRDGAILGVDLAALARNFGAGSGRTEFTTVRASFTIENGVLRNEDFAFYGPLIRVTGSGTVDIGNRSQRLRLVPEAVASLGGDSAASGLRIFPIIVSGTWSAPRFAPDLSGAVEAMLLDPEGTVRSVTEAAKGLKGLKKGLKENPAAAAGALIGALTGGAVPGGTAPGGTITGAARPSATGPLDSPLPGAQASGDGAATQQPTGPAGLLGGLLGALTGTGQAPSAPAPDAGATGRPAAPAVPPDGTVPQGTPAGSTPVAALPGVPASEDGSEAGPGPEAPAGDAAPPVSPLPRPAAPARLARFGAAEPASPGAPPEAAAPTAPAPAAILEQIVPPAAPEPAPETVPQGGAEAAPAPAATDETAPQRKKKKGFALEEILRAVDPKR